MGWNIGDSLYNWLSENVKGYSGSEEIDNEAYFTVMEDLLDFIVKDMRDFNKGYRKKFFNEVGVLRSGTWLDNGLERLHSTVGGKVRKTFGDTENRWAMLERDVKLFKDMRKDVVEKATEVIRKLSEEHPDIVSFSAKEIDDLKAFVSDIDDKGIHITQVINHPYMKTKEYIFPLSIITAEGFKSYISENTPKKMGVSREYLEYLKLKKKFEVKEQ